MKGNLILNMKEQRMNDIIIKLLSKEISISQASRLTGLSERQLYRKKKAYHIIKLNNQKSLINTNSTVPVYTFLDGTKHILFNDIWYDLETINVEQIEINKQLTSNSNLAINVSKSHKPINSPWSKWNPNKIF